MDNLRATFVPLLLALAACSVGEVPSGGTPMTDAPVSMVDAAVGTSDGPAGMIDASGGDDPAATYKAKIFPLVSNETPLGVACNSGGCHTPGSQPPDFASFDTFASTYRAKPGATARVVTKGQHRGPALTDKSKAIFIAWIDSLPDQ